MLHLVSFNATWKSLNSDRVVEPVFWRWSQWLGRFWCVAAAIEWAIKCYKLIEHSIFLHLFLCCSFQSLFLARSFLLHFDRFTINPFQKPPKKSKSMKKKIVHVLFFFTRLFFLSWQKFKEFINKNRLGVEEIDWILKVIRVCDSSNQSNYH